MAYVISTIGQSTWTVPSGITEITVECIGAGANGSVGIGIYVGVGGGGGGYSKTTLQVTPGQVLYLSVPYGNTESSTYLSTYNRKPVNTLEGCLANNALGQPGGSLTSPNNAVGTTRYIGGNGGSSSTNYSGGGGGGGGSAGPTGKGINGLPGDGSWGGNGGGGSLGSALGGLGGSSSYSAHPGGSSVLGFISVGGGGGGGSGVPEFFSGSSGGTYGGGGGGAGASGEYASTYYPGWTRTAGLGVQGVIVISSMKGFRNGATVVNSLAKLSFRFVRDFNTIVDSIANYNKSINYTRILGYNCISVPSMIINLLFKRTLTAISTAVASTARNKFWGNPWSFVYALSKFIGVKIGSALSATSTTGATWTSNTLPSNKLWSAIATDGTNVVTIAMDSNSAAVSTNGGSTWVSKTLPTSRHWSAITCQGTTFVGVSLQSDKCVRSTDGGNTWTEITLPALANWTSITNNGTNFVAITDSLVSAYSADGLTWTQVSMPANLHYNCVAWANNQFTAVASGPTNKAAKSADGITWTALTMPAVANWTNVGPGVGEPNA